MNPAQRAAEHRSSVLDAVRDGQLAQVRELTDTWHPADVADLIETQPATERCELADALVLSADILRELPAEVREEVIRHVGIARSCSNLDAIDTDDVVEIVEGLETDLQSQVLDQLSPSVRREVETALAFPEESAGRLAQTFMLTASANASVAEVLTLVRHAPADHPIHNVFVVNESQQPIGVISLDKLVRAEVTALAKDIMVSDIDTVEAHVDQEEVAALFRDHDLVSAVVTDDRGRAIGEITIDDIVDVIDEEAEEDLLHLGGLARDDLYRAVFDTVKSRIGWLTANLVTAIIASIVIAQFSDALETIVALAVLMPIVASMSGNAGTQTMTVAVRALAHQELSTQNSVRFFFKEAAVGLTNGLTFAVLTGAVAGVWFRDAGVAAVIAMAMIVSMLVSGAAGACIPAALQKLGADPAVGSTVLLTTVTDVVGFLSFLGLATLVLL